MKNKRTMLLIAFLIFSLYIAIVGTIGAGKPTIVEVTSEPDEPSALSTITFTAVITSEDDLEEVRLIVQECKESLCFTNGFNESMALVDTDTYETTITLTHNDATYIKYHIKTKSDGTWHKDDITEFDLEIGTDNGNSNGNNNNENGNDKTPGFEIISMMIAIAIGTLAFKRKR